MELCTNCGGQVSKDFVRVFGVGERGVDGCPFCFPRADVVSDRVVFGPS